MAQKFTEEQRAKRKAYMKAWAASERGKAWRAAYIKKWEAKNATRRLAYKRKNRRHFYYKATHGISEAEYNAMSKAQCGICSLCGLPPSGRGPAARLAVDHDHQTGGIRALLCLNCNAGLGNFRDDIERLRAAIAYLEKHAANAEDGG